MMPTDGPRLKDLPFQEAIDGFRSKLNMPTRHYTDVLEAEHARAFMVAGAMQDDLLSGFREAIDKALAKGTTLAEFRRDFDRLVKTHGWSYHGERGWRSRTIFQTNLRTSYMSGKWKQAQETKDTRPYGRYVATLDRRTRAQHKAWHGMVVPLDDPWWDAHFPPNGWGCRCSMQTVSDYDMRRERWEATSPPPDKPVTVMLRGPVPVKTVPGVDPGWAYNPGKASWGTRLSDQAVAGLKADGTWKNRTNLLPGDYKTYELPAKLTEHVSKTKLAEKAQTPDMACRILEKVLGGPEKIFTGADGAGVLVSAAALAAHNPERSPFYPLLPELIEEPEEIWLTLDRHEATGKVELRKRYLKLLRAGTDRRAMYLVAQVVKGQLTAWTLVPASSPSILNNQRKGKLLWRLK